MDKTIFNGFYDKFNVATRPGRGGRYPYVAANDVTDRMNRLFQGNWCTEVTFQHAYEDGTVIVRVKVSVLDSESKMWFYHEGFGGHKDAGGEPGSSFKSAYSKALVNACRRWGVGLYLDDEAGTQTGPPTHGPKPSAALPTQGLPPAPVKPAGPPIINKPPVVQEMKIQQVPTTTTMVQSPMPEPLRMNESIPKVPEPIHGAPLNGAPIMGKTPTPAVETAPPMSKPMSITTETPSVENISDVQKIAIQSLYDMRGYKYEDLAQQVLGSVPNVNTLTHDQAVAVIQHGNDLYKKNKTN